MFFGPDRFDLIGEELLRVLQGELDARGLRASPEEVARRLGLSPEALWEWLDKRDRRGLDELVARWNAHAHEYGFARVILVDHGHHEAEIFLGHPLRPEHLLE